MRNLTPWGSVLLGTVQPVRGMFSGVISMPLFQPQAGPDSWANKTSSSTAQASNAATQAASAPVCRCM